MSFSLSSLRIKHGYSDVKKVLLHDFTLSFWWQLGREKKSLKKEKLNSDIMLANLFI